MAEHSDEFERPEPAPYDELSEDDVMALQAENERLRAELRRLRARARRWGPCDGCGHPYREDEHVPGQTKCCPDCTHTASLSGKDQS